MTVNRDQKDKGHPKAILIGLVLFLGVGIILSYRTVRRNAESVKLMAEGCRIVNGKLIKTYYNGVSGVRHAEVAYIYNGKIQTISPRYNIPCSGSGSWPDAKYKSDSIPVAVSTQHIGRVSILLTKSDFEEAGVQYTEVPLREIACLRTAVSVNY